MAQNQKIRYTEIFPSYENRILDKTDIYVDIYKLDKSEHCFSGPTDYSTFELRKDQLITITKTTDMNRTHLICISRDVLISDEIHFQLQTKGVKEVFLFTTDMRYLVPWKLLIYHC